MALMGSSKLNKGCATSSDLLYDPIRKLWTKKTPEEVVRQTLLQAMIKALEFPAALIGVEFELKQLPHLASHKRELPNRRADIICFAKEIHPSFSLFPLLLVECKEESITQAAIEQAIGYNAFVEAPFIALADATGVSLLLPGGTLQKGLPSYPELIKAVNS
jgi:hypothetical protein